MDIEIKIIRKNVKHLRVSVDAGTLLVSAPKNMSEKLIFEVIDQNEEELLKLVQNAQNKKYQNDLENGEVYLFGNKIYTTITSEKNLEEFYRSELYKILPEIFKKYNQLTGLREKEFKVRKMKARWGTCYPTKGLINISLNLAKRSVEEIELVVLHELIHLKHQNHSRDFYIEMQKYMSNYKEIEKRLKE